MNIKQMLLAMAVAGLSIEAPAVELQGGVQSSTDPARVAAVEQRVRELRARGTGQPMVMFRGTVESGVAIYSGGNTVGDRERMQAERGQYSLWVTTVAKPSGAYLADVRLRVVDRANKAVVLERTLEGPWLMAALPAGKYEVTASFRGEGDTRNQVLASQVSVPKSGQRQVVLRFDSAATLSPDLDGPARANPFAAPSTKP